MIGYLIRDRNTPVTNSSWTLECGWKQRRFNRSIASFTRRDVLVTLLHSVREEKSHGHPWDNGAVAIADWRAQDSDSSVQAVCQAFFSHLEFEPD
ncbi:hypothetical protein AArcMg_1901 [Natrarchaeobaculum sulfurireducens]|uniref:Uncharacterized protein n=1 Tax=Natrarchaeobaculum sulfurireducens TaxID=2044521 RepID=A0A346PQW3_9EURY|nr:hypothetical protein AArcMg_1901 [Natrarchaeobaculum sulfurireducens]